VQLKFGWRPFAEEETQCVPADTFLNVQAPLLGFAPDLVGMGVPGFIPWFQRRYPEAFVVRDAHGTNFDHLYIDMASILHTVLRKGE
jgi:XRN 5'-3' exonuclease N-terminus